MGSYTTRPRKDPLSGPPRAPPYNLGLDRLLCITIAGHHQEFIRDHSHNQRIHLVTPCDVCGVLESSLVTRSAAARWCKQVYSGHDRSLDVPITADVEKGLVLELQTLKSKHEEPPNRLVGQGSRRTLTALLDVARWGCFG